MIQFFNQSPALNLKGFSKVRPSVDNKINNIGKKIIDIFKNNNMFIITGRFCTDINCGSSTYKTILLLTILYAQLTSLVI